MNRFYKILLTDEEKNEEIKKAPNGACYHFSGDHLNSLTYGIGNKATIVAIWRNTPAK